jgi:hypothetical protein
MLFKVFCQAVRPFVISATFALSFSAQAAPGIAPPAFDPVQQVQGVPLQLNGTGTRYKVILKVYDMALYTPRKASSLDELMAQPGPKRLNFVARRDIPGTDLGLAFIRGLSNNSSSTLIQKHVASSTRLIEIFSGRNKLAEGDTFAMEYQPGKGTAFFIQGQQQGAPVGDAEFFKMVMGVWIGPVPVDFKLKDALLGL